LRAHAAFCGALIPGVSCRARVWTSTSPYGQKAILRGFARLFAARSVSSIICVMSPAV
jgi:hypothetical protein